MTPACGGRLARPEYATASGSSSPAMDSAARTSAMSASRRKFTPISSDDRPAPPGQEIRLRTLGKLQRPHQGLGKIIIQQLGLQSAPQEIGPEELAEGGRVLGVSAAAPQFPGQTAEGVIDEVPDTTRHILVAAAVAVFIKGVQ